MLLVSTYLKSIEAVIYFVQFENLKQDTSFGSFLMCGISLLIKYLVLFNSSRKATEAKTSK